MGEVFDGGEYFFLGVFVELFFVVGVWFVALVFWFIFCWDVVWVAHEFPFVDEAGVYADEVVFEVVFCVDDFFCFEVLWDGLAEGFVDVTEVSEEDGF